MSVDFGMVLSVGQNVAANVMVMLLLMLVGFIFAKKGILTDAGIKQITELVLWGAVPCLIINSYQRALEPSLVKNLLIALAVSVGIHILYMLIAPLIFRSRPDKRDRVSKFGIIYSNCGFMALPLVQAVYGAEGVFYTVAYVTVFNVLYWTQGVYLYTKDFKQLSLKKAILNPGVLGAAIGMTLFFTETTLPAPIGKTVGYLASVNTPLPMIVLGTYLVKLNIKETLKNASLWAVTVIRLIALPLISIFIFKLLNLDTIMAMPLLMACACPSAAVATLFAVRYDLDSGYATQAVSFTTLLSVITIPIIMMIATILL